MIVITYGTFDCFHHGHWYLLKRAADFGGELIVYVSSDEFNKLKGKKSKFKYQERVDILKSLKFVDSIHKEESWEQKVDDVKYWQEFDEVTLVMGDDWKDKFDYLPCPVVYLPRTEGISSTQIRNGLGVIR